eukprot:7391976-Prymnesium_polylepis.7
MIAPNAGLNIRFTPSARHLAHSLPCSERTPAWNATSAAEQAVSYAAHAPCRPSTYDSRPDAIESELPVAAYTPAPAGDAASTSSNACVAMPTYTPVKLPLMAGRSNPVSCSASYPRSSNRRCCGSIAAASAGGTPKSLLSNKSAPCTNAPCRSALQAPLASPTATLHRESGTSDTRLTVLLAHQPACCCQATRAAAAGHPHYPPLQRRRSPAQPRSQVRLAR